MDRQADIPALIGDRPCHGLPDPPCRIRAEAESAGIIKLLNSPHQTDIAFLDQILHGKSSVEVIPGDRNNKTEVAVDQLLLCVLIPFTDCLGRLVFFLRRQQRDPADLLHVVGDRITCSACSAVRIRLSYDFLIDFVFFVSYLIFFEFFELFLKKFIFFAQLI